MFIENSKAFLRNKDRLDILFCGEGGQGIIIMTYLTGKAVILGGRESIQTQRYGPESRGTPVKSNLVVSKNEIKYPFFEAMDILVSMAQGGYELNRSKVREGGIVFIDSSFVKNKQVKPNVISIPATNLAKQRLGNNMVANTLMLGFVCRMLGGFFNPHSFKKSIKESIDPKFVDLNLRAFDLGYSWRPKEESDSPKDGENEDGTLEC